MELQVTEKVFAEIIKAFATALSKGGWWYIYGTWRDGWIEAAWATRRVVKRPRACVALLDTGEYPVRDLPVDRYEVLTWLRRSGFRVTVVSLN